MNVYHCNKIHYIECSGDVASGGNARNNENASYHDTGNNNASSMDAKDASKSGTQYYEDRQIT